MLKHNYKLVILGDIRTHNTHSLSDRNSAFLQHPKNRRFFTIFISFSGPNSLAPGDEKTAVEPPPTILRRSDAPPFRRLSNVVHSASRRRRDRRLSKQKLWRRFLLYDGVRRRSDARPARRPHHSIQTLLGSLPEMANQPSE